MPDPLLRQWEMLKLIPRERKITVKELHSKLQGLGFDVTRRTLERDLERLSIPFCLESDTRSKPFGWRYALNMKTPTIPGLSATEALTLLLLETYLKHMLPVAVADNLAVQFAAARQYFTQQHPDLKFREWLKKIKVISPGQPLLPPVWESGIQRLVCDALLHGLQLEMHYATAGSTQAKYYPSVHLQGLVQYGHVIYLVVTINEHEDLRLLVLHRIQKLTLKDQPLRPLPGFNLDQYIEQGGFGFGEETTLIKLVARFKNGAGHHLVETPLSADQQIDRLDAQCLQITATVRETPKLLWWLTGFGPDVEVLAPESLRQSLAERHRQAVNQYEVR